MPIRENWRATAHKVGAELTRAGKAIGNAPRETWTSKLNNDFGTFNAKSSNDDIGDAFRHYMTAATAKRYLDHVPFVEADLAEWLAVATGDIAEQAATFENVMDRINNRLGAAAGSAERDSWNAFFRFLKDVAEGNVLVVVKNEGGDSIGLRNTDINDIPHGRTTDVLEDRYRPDRSQPDFDGSGAVMQA